MPPNHENTNFEGFCDLVFLWQNEKWIKELSIFGFAVRLYNE